MRAVRVRLHRRCAHRKASYYSCWMHTNNIPRIRLCRQPELTLHAPFEADTHVYLTHVAAGDMRI